MRIGNLIYAATTVFAVSSCAIQGRASLDSVRATPIDVGSRMQEALTRGEDIDVAQALVLCDQRYLWLAFLARNEGDATHVWMTADRSELKIRYGRVTEWRYPEKGLSLRLQMSEDPLSEWLRRGGEIPAIGAQGVGRAFELKGNTVNEFKYRISGVSIFPALTQRGIRLVMAITEDVLFSSSGVQRRSEIWVDSTTRELLYLRTWLTAEESTEIEIVRPVRYADET